MYTLTSNSGRRLYSIPSDSDCECTCKNKTLKSGPEVWYRQDFLTGEHIEVILQEISYIIRTLLSVNLYWYVIFCCAIYPERNLSDLWLKHKPHSQNFRAWLEEGKQMCRHPFSPCVFHIAFLLQLYLVSLKHEYFLT